MVMPYQCKPSKKAKNRQKAPLTKPLMNHTQKTWVDMFLPTSKIPHLQLIEIHLQGFWTIFYLRQSQYSMNFQKPQPLAISDQQQRGCFFFYT